MGMEQGGYIEGDEQGTYGYGGGGGFDIGMGAGGDSYGGGSLDFGDSDFYYGYGAGESQSSGDLYGAYLDFYLDQGFDFTTAAEFAAQDAAYGSIETITDEAGNLPGVAWPDSLPMTPYLWEMQSYTPVFPDLPAPLPPTITPTIPLNVAQPPQVPLPVATSPQPVIAPGLPPACPTGSYHPFPLGHPDQNKCVPFPPMQQPAPAPKQTAPGPVPASTAPKPPTAPKPVACPSGQFRDPASGQCKPIPQGQPQACPSGYYRSSAGQCLPIPRCTTPGTVFDAAQGLCVPTAQAIAPVSEWDSIFGGFKNIPWWVWAGLAGLLLLGRDDDKPTRRRAY